MDNHHSDSLLEDLEGGEGVSAPFRTSWKHIAQWYFQLLQQNSRVRTESINVLVRLIYTIIAIYTASTADSLGMSAVGSIYLFDTLGLVVNLGASLLEYRKSTYLFQLYSYGFGRFGVISTFANSLFLIFTALFILKEAVHRVADPEPVERLPVFCVCLAGLVVSGVGAALIQPPGLKKRRGNRYSSSIDLKAFLSENVASVLVMISSLLGFLLADPIAGIVIAFIVLIQVFPVAIDSANVLLLASPNPPICDMIETIIKDVKSLDGVLSCGEEHFWTQCSGQYIGALKVRCAGQVDEQELLEKILELFRPVVKDVTVQIEKENFQNLHNEPSSPIDM